MSLVAYAASSSDEDSENEDDNQQRAEENVVQNRSTLVAAPEKNLKHNQIAINGHISDDDDDDYVPIANSIQDLAKHKPISLSLPKPINSITTSNDPSEELDDVVTPIFSKLPMPKDTHKVNDIIEEEDDEFLHKKAVVLPDSDLKKPSAPTQSARTTVKITIPSMKEFADVDEDLAKSGQQIGMQSLIQSTKKSGLLEVLPRAKSEQNFAKSESRPSTSNVSNRSAVVASVQTAKSSLIPDTVRNRRPAKNTEGVDGVKCSTSTNLKTKQKSSAMLVDCSDSDESGDEDFFSLNDDEKLPEVNHNELNVMVAKRAAKMAVAADKYLELNAASTSTNDEEKSPDEEELRHAQKRFHDTTLNEEALHALVGSKSKRRRQQNKNIEIVDISGSQVLPDRDEWMRTALASSTTYQPTGVLVDEEPASGTKRKHQITYLAHKAKANEAELQAMWAANRQNRRATQSKYGF